jgi:MYXO-CTERM domain-containing protein
MRNALTLAAVILVSLAASAAWGQPVVDGVVDTLYGAAQATDKEGDGNGQAVMDLRQLYLWHDTTDLYIAFTVKGDVTAQNSDWGKYVIYIDTTNDGQGATSDPWLRNVVALDPHKPEYSLNTWVDQLPYSANRVEVWQWSSGAWGKGKKITAAAMSASSQGTVFEYQIPLTLIGSPAQIWLEVWSTSGKTSDNAQDTINNPAEDWNATNWSAKAQLQVTTAYSLAPPPDAGLPDSAVPDAAVPDAMLPDSAAPDSAAPDSAAPDSAAPDSAAPDSAAPDSAAPDSAAPDSAVPDSAAPDSAAPDSAAPDSAVPDAATPDAPTPDAGVPDAPGDTTPADDAATADGSPGFDGAVDLAGADATPPADGPPSVDSGTKTSQDEGCSCSLPSSSTSAVPAVLLLALLLAMRRRRR